MSSPARLFIGNLAPQVDEYTLIQVFSKYGPLAKLDLLYHKAGPQKGQPRGYAFVEFLEPADAVSAQSKLHDRLLRGRRLVVTNANAAPLEGRKPEVAKTALSLLKAKKSASAEDQIAAMEAKLAAMSRRKDREPTPERVAAEELEAEVRGMAEAAERRAVERRSVSPRREDKRSARENKRSASRSPRPPRRDYTPVDPPRRSASPVPAQRSIAGLPQKPAFL